MNDFTKEELEDIGVCVYEVCSSSTISQMCYGALQEKIQSMIDNYCDHASAISNFGTVLHCTHCHKLVGGEKIPNDENCIKYSVPNFKYKIVGDCVYAAVICEETKNE